MVQFVNLCIIKESMVPKTPILFGVAILGHTEWLYLWHYIRTHNLQDLTIKEWIKFKYEQINVGRILLVL